MTNAAVNRNAASSYVKSNSGYPPQKPGHGRGFYASGRLWIVSGKQVNGDRGLQPRGTGRRWRRMTEN